MPRVAGINLAAAIAAAVAFWLIGALWYGLFFQDAWMALSGFTPADAEGEGWKMAFGPIMPIVTVVALATVFRLKGGSLDVVRGAAHALLLCVGFALPVLAYDLVYAKEPLGLFLIDASHLLAAYAVAGGILGGFR